MNTKFKTVMAMALTMSSFSASSYAYEVVDDASNNVEAYSTDASVDVNAVDATSFDEGNVQDQDQVQADGLRVIVRPGPRPVVRPGRGPVVRPGRGPVVRPGRVYAPIRYRRGGYRWARWNYPVFVRPVYYFNWVSLRAMTCTSQDSIGNQYPVTEEGYVGVVYRDRLIDIEDASLNRCFAESGGDTGCRLVGCTPVYL